MKLPFAHTARPTRENSRPTHCEVWRLGVVDYLDAWKLQRQLAEARATGRTEDVLLLLEHPPTYTLGVTTDETHLLVPREQLLRQGIAVVEVDRGGDITYHGPGQAVGYPILDISSHRGGALRYLRDLEEVLMRALHAMDVCGRRLRPFTGVWVGEEKIAAIGVKVNARNITTHGFALNVCPDLKAFDRIVPCGIQGKAVTSLEKVLGHRVPMEDVMEEVVGAFGQVFGRMVVMLDAKRECL
ncbi:MAG TPA: octanoyltransferase [Syntrophobacteraceae bacterium]|nr:octanoyltransferase [Syntrophobacteraceae bacterium]